MPIDGSEYSFKAAAYALKIAKYYDAEVNCIHVIGAAPYYVNNKPIVYPEPYYNEVRAEAERWFSEIKEMADETQIQKVTKLEVRLVATSVPDAILDYAEQQGTDLIVIGTRGITGVKRFLLGSVASAVVHHAPCPVLVVR